MAVYDEAVGVALLLRRAIQAGEPRATGGVGLVDLHRRLSEVAKASTSALTSWLPADLDYPPLANTTSYRSPLHKWADCVDRDFRSFGQATLRLVAEMRSVDNFVELGRDHDLVGDLRFLTHMKSPWYGEFSRTYRAGVVDLPAKLLRRTFLRFPIGRSVSPSALYSFNGYDDLVCEEELNLESPAAIRELIADGERNSQILYNVRDELRGYILAEFTLEDMLQHARPRA